MIINPIATILNTFTAIRASRHEKISESYSLQHSTFEELENKIRRRRRKIEGNMKQKPPLYKTDPEFKKAVDGLEETAKSYRDFYNSLPPEKQAAEDYFWQGFVSSLD